MKDLLKHLPIQSLEDVISKMIVEAGGNVEFFYNVSYNQEEIPQEGVVEVYEYIMIVSTSTTFEEIERVLKELSFMEFRLLTELKAKVEGLYKGRYVFYIKIKR